MFVCVIIASQGIKETLLNRFPRLLYEFIFPPIICEGYMMFEFTQEYYLTSTTT